MGMRVPIPNENPAAYKCNICGNLFVSAMAARGHIKMGHVGRPNNEFSVVPNPNYKDPKATPQQNITIKSVKQPGQNTQSIYVAPRPITLEEDPKGEPVAETKPAAPAAPQPNWMTEETGQKLCKGLECFETTAKMFQDAMAKLQSQQPVVQQPAAAKPDDHHAEHEKPSAPADATVRKDNPPALEGHTVEKIQKTEMAIDNMVRCHDCNPVLRKKVEYHWKELFPGMVLRREDGSIPDPTVKPAAPPAGDQAVPPVTTKGEPAAATDAATQKSQTKPVKEEKPATEPESDTEDEDDADEFSLDEFGDEDDEEETGDDNEEPEGEDGASV